METLKTKSKSSVQSTKQSKLSGFDAALRGLGVRFQENVNNPKKEKKEVLEKSK
jgi:hypothetical protein